MSDTTQGDASVILARQLIAALLNGGLSDPNISATVAQAQLWLSACSVIPCGVPSSSPTGAVAIDLAATLDEYCNGHLGTPSCE